MPYPECLPLCTEVLLYSLSVHRDLAAPAATAAKAATIATTAQPLLFQDVPCERPSPRCRRLPVRCSAKRCNISSDLPEELQLHLACSPLECQRKDGGGATSNSYLAACDGRGPAGALHAWIGCGQFANRASPCSFSLVVALRRKAQLYQAQGTDPGNPNSTNSASTVFPEQQQRLCSRSVRPSGQHSMKKSVPAPPRPASPFSGGAARQPVVRCREPP